MAWGFQSWDAAGKPNNFGIVPISVIGRISMSLGQQSGTYSFSVYPGYGIRFIIGLAGGGFVEQRRTIVVSGTNIIVGAAQNNSMGTSIYAADSSDILVYTVKL